MLLVERQEGTSVSKPVWDIVLTVNISAQGIRPEVPFLFRYDWSGDL